MRTLWGVRHVRYLCAVVMFNLWWRDVGRFLGAVPSEADLRHLADIWEGRA